MEKEMKKGFKKVHATERTVFNDEEQRRCTFVNAAFTYLILNLFWQPLSFQTTASAVI